SRMSSYQIPKKLKELEAKYDSKECLDTAIATNMIAVGMDVDRLGLMAVTGQPKQNSEYIQATSRIGRSYPGLVITLYNPYRPRDLSHYENFTGYHSQLYRFVEGTTATPFSARARDRAMHALIISAIRLKYPELSSNDGAAQIQSLSSDDINDVKNIILKRLNIIKPEAKYEVIDEFDRFIDAWIDLSRKDKTLYYFTQKTKDYNRLMNHYGEYCTNSEKATLNSMREVESSANMYYYSED
ncbi:MAG: helicase, partial [Lactobacillus sp.]|nr:helicase [Lactobacillus sp.]